MLPLHQPHHSSNTHIPTSSLSSSSSTSSSTSSSPSSSSSSTSTPSTASSQQILYPWLHDPSTEQIGSTSSTSPIYSSNSIPSLIPNTTLDTTTTTTTTPIAVTTNTEAITTTYPTPTPTRQTNSLHQPLEWFNYSCSTTNNPIVTRVSTNNTTASSSPLTFLNHNTLDNSDRINNNLFLRSGEQPSDMTLKTVLSPSPVAIPSVPSSSSSSTHSSSSSPLIQQKSHPPFDPSNQIEHMLTNTLPISTSETFPNQFSTIHSHHTKNNQPLGSSYVGNYYASRPSTAPSLPIWSSPDNPIMTQAPSSTINPTASMTLPSTNLVDFDDTFKSFLYQPHHNPPSNLSNFNQLPHLPHLPLMVNPSQDFLDRHDLPPYHDLISSPQSASPAQIIAQNPFHSQHLPIHQHSFRPLSSSPIDHSSFHHTHSQLGGWQPIFDPVHLATCYDPFQIKHRRRTTPNQLSLLESQFQINCKPDVSLRKQLADQLDMTPREVQVWFQNRRAKTKKLERRAEQESGKPTESDSIPNSSQSATSPPASVYLSPTSLQGIALPITHESPEDARIGASPPRFLTSAVRSFGEIDEDRSASPYRVESDRRHRSRSLHHHPYHVPSPNSLKITTGPHNTFNSFNGGRMLDSNQQLTDGSDVASISGRSSTNTANRSSTAATADSTLLCTPTNTEFGSEYTTETPNGHDPRRRSSCPAEFIQSFGHFGFAMNPSLDPNSQSELKFCLTSNSQNCEPLNKPSLDSISAPFAVGPDQQWIQQQRYRNDLAREGIQRRHSLATMNSPTESDDNSNRQDLTTAFNSNPGFSSLFSMDSTRYPPKVLSGIDSNPLNGAKTNPTRGGYVRRASTSLLKSIEEHPGNA